MKKFWSMLSILLAVMVMMSCTFIAQAEDVESTPAGVVTDHGAIVGKEWYKDGQLIPEKLRCHYSPVIERVFYEDDYYEDMVITVEHVWDPATNTATCTEPGVVSCANCGDTKPTPALGHLWSSEVEAEDEWGRVIDEATCKDGDTGLAEDYCVRCEIAGDKTRVIDSPDHVWMKEYPVEIRKPHCYVEGDYYENDDMLYTETSADGVEVTYVKGWYRLDQDCKFCDAVKKGEPIAITVAEYQQIFNKPEYDGHDWDAWVTEIAVKCDKDGREVKWCKHCGTEMWRTVKALNHSKNEDRDDYGWLILDQHHLIDCFTRIDKFHCDKCGEKFEGYFDKMTGEFHQDETYPTETHVYPAKVQAVLDANGTITAETLEAWLVDPDVAPYIDSSEKPDCENNGKVVVKCIFADEVDGHDDGDKVTIVVDALGHDWIGWVVEHKVDDKNAGNEYAHWVNTCARCGLTKDFNGNYSPEACPEDAHQYEVIETVDATCTEAGSTFKVCKVCGNAVTEEIPALGHTWGEGAATEASCTEAGFTSYTCTVCGATKTEAGAEATGHAWNDGEVVVEAKCGVEGKILYTCTKCDAVKVEIVPALEHVIVVDEAVEPQVGVEGKTEGSHCELCGEILVAQETIPALVANEYEVVLDDVTEAEGDPSNVDGIGKVEKKEGTAPEQKMWARVSHSWVDADGFTYGAVTVVAVDEDGTFVMPSYSGYEDMTLVNVNVVLVNDRAGRAGAYAPYAISKPASK